jgi:hypothetical protein
VVEWLLENKREGAEDRRCSDSICDPLQLKFYAVGK